MEKFAIRKADRFLIQGNFLVLPGLELIYVWNGFKILGKSYTMIEPIYVLVEKAAEELDKEKGKFFIEQKWVHYHDKLIFDTLSFVQTLCISNFEIICRSAPILQRGLLPNHSFEGCLLKVHELTVTSRRMF